MKTTEKKNEPLEFWAILELMGHRRLGGYLSEQTVAGASFLRIDVPSQCSATSDQFCPVCGDCKCADVANGKDDAICPLHAEKSKHGDLVATQFYSASAVYCITPTTEEMAKAVAAKNEPAPIQRWELPHKELAAKVSDEDEYDDPQF